MKTIEIYDMFEVRVKSQSEVSATFSNGEREYKVNGFKISKDEYAVRFMPEAEGVWNYKLFGGSGESGSFSAGKATGNNHGKVCVKDKKFVYSDGSAYLPVGTTCYAWIHQTEELVNQTLDTLKGSPFNKIRMCVFPKDMCYNKNEPPFFPFEKNSEGEWDVNALVYEFWDHLDYLIKRLAELGIEADLILFHPYDRWGFSKLSREDNLKYLNYCIDRLSAHRNVWWSLANEYDMNYAKTGEDWDIFGQTLAEQDIYGHLRSIHNCFMPYPKKDWMTHCSIQTKTVKNALLWMYEYNIPVIIDECGYEGDIEFLWGNLFAFELVNRAWTTVACGAYITHGETFHREDEVLWWAKGGKLYGQSPARFAFLREIQQEIGATFANVAILNFNPDQKKEQYGDTDTGRFLKLLFSIPDGDRQKVMLEELLPTESQNDKYKIIYLERRCQKFFDLNLPQSGSYKIEVLDVWEMTRTTAFESANGRVRVPLPAKEGVAILITLKEGEGFSVRRQM